MVGDAGASVTPRTEGWEEIEGMGRSVWEVVEEMFERIVPASLSRTEQCHSRRKSLVSIPFFFVLRKATRFEREKVLCFQKSISPRSKPFVFFCLFSKQNVFFRVSWCLRFHTLLFGNTVRDRETETESETVLMKIRWRNELETVFGMDRRINGREIDLLLCFGFLLVVYFVTNFGALWDFCE